MEIKITQQGKRTIAMIDNARITRTNFEGREEQYNRKGDRNFLLVLPTQEIAEQLLDLGLNVKIKAPREDGDEPFRFVKVKVNFDSYRPPRIHLITNGMRRELNEETVGMLDRIDIANVDLDLSLHEWTRPDGSGVTAYLQAIHVVQDLDRFAARYAEEEYPEE